MLNPTKGNLIKVKNSLSLATVGYDLMDRKRNILVREMMGLIDRAGGIQSKINSTFSDAYDALMRAYVSGADVRSIAQGVPVDDCVTVLEKSVMGVEIPTVKYVSPQIKPYYGINSSGCAMDEAYVSFLKVKELCAELAEIESSIYRLAVAIRKTQKRANALKNVVIPGYKNDIAYITDFLEEKEREEFIRMKVIKKQKEQ